MHTDLEGTEEDVRGGLITRWVHKEQVDSVLLGAQACLHPDCCLRLMDDRQVNKGERVVLLSSPGCKGGAIIGAHPFSALDSII